MAHFASYDLNAAWIVMFGLLSWAIAYLYLTREITPKSVADFMSLITAVLPLASLFFSAAMFWILWTSKKAHPYLLTIFGVLVAASLVAIWRGYQDSDVRRALKSKDDSALGFGTVMRRITWGSIGIVLVFAALAGLIFGGWELVQGSSAIGGWAAALGSVVVVAGHYPRDASLRTANPVRRAVLALKGDHSDGSSGYIGKLLAQTPP
ncbi:MAG: hypothetical protein ABSF84_03000 [Acidimicrobiales bacterium]|jgi:hypothetical protein